MGRRDPQFERDLADLVTRHAQLSGLGEAYGAAVQHRLSKGARQYGAGSWAEQGLERLLGELIEEGADGGGWGTLAARLCHLEQLAGTLDPADAEQVLGHLVNALAGAVALWYHGSQALAALEQAR